MGVSRPVFSPRPKVNGNIWQRYYQAWHCYFSLSVMECDGLRLVFAETRRIIRLSVGAYETQAACRP
jgi:hypothetical protein